MSANLVTHIFSFRMTEQERIVLNEMAQNLGVSNAALIRLKLFSKDFEQSYKLLCMKRHERNELAQVLSALGASRIANNLIQIANAVNTGTLEVTPDVIAKLNEAYDTVMWMRQMLIKGLGVKA